MNSFCNALLIKTQSHNSMKNCTAVILLASVICFIVLHFRISAIIKHERLERAIHQRLRRRHGQGAPGTVPGRIGTAAGLIPGMNFSFSFALARVCHTPFFPPNWTNVVDGEFAPVYCVLLVVVI